MKKLLLTILGILGVGYFIYFLTPGESPRYPTAGTNIIVFGDSLAAGVGASEGMDLASQIEKALRQNVYNLGVSGNTTADGVSRMDEVLRLDPRVVVVLLGGNDALRKQPIEETFANLEIIITTLHEAGAAVVLVGEPSGLNSSQFNKEYERLAKTHRTFFVSNILAGLIGHSEYMSDYIHPNDAGYTIAAERIIPEVKKALE